MSKEKGVLPIVFCSSVVAALVTASVRLLANVSIFIRCCFALCAPGIHVFLTDRESIIRRRNTQQFNFGVYPSLPVSISSRRKKSCRGITLIEVLVTLVLLSVGLLGLAAMQIRALQMNQSAYMRSQAVSLSQDMVDRMRINWAAAEGGDYELALATDRAAIEDAPDDSVQRILANQDVRDWLGFIQISLPAGDGSISRTGNRFNINVCWDDNRDPGKPAPSLACGADGLESNVLEVTL